MYFDHLPHRKPDRALELALEVLRSESDKPTVMQLNDKFMMALMYAHGAAVIDRIEREAEDNARLRWLLGGVHFGPDEKLKRSHRGDRRPARLAKRCDRAQNPETSARLRSHVGRASWRGPGSSNIRNPSVTATTISSR